MKLAGHDICFVVTLQNEFCVCPCSCIWVSLMYAEAFLSSCKTPFFCVDERNGS